MRRAFAAFILFLLVSSAFGDYKEHYKEGIKAVDRKNWEEVARRMRSAIAERATSNEKIVIYGMRIEPYLPQYYLGLALFNAGDCEGAIDAFNAAESQSSVRQSSVYKNLEKLRGDCAKRIGTKPVEPVVSKPTVVELPVQKEPEAAKPSVDPALISRAVQQAQGEIQKAEKSLQGVTRMKNETGAREAWSRDASLRTRESQASQSLATARAKFAAGATASDLVELNAATEAAIAARLLFEEVRLDARALAKQADASPTTTEKPSAGPGTPPALVDAARAYFRGDYNKSLAALQSLSTNDPRANAYAALFRGASRFALYTINGKKDNRLMQQAAADLRSARKLDPSLQVTSQVFSPRLVEFIKTLN